jgi:AcrR family transcriptional regulator
LLESAARGLSRHGYGNLVLEQVAREAGYTRGALYHQFEDKEDLALAVVEWVDETWRREVDGLVEQEPDPVAALIALARGHAVFCRRDVAGVAMALRVEFSGQDHPVGREVERISETLVKRCARLINAGRRDGSIPPGPPARVDRARRASTARRAPGCPRDRGRARVGQPASTPTHLTYSDHGIRAMGTQLEVDGNRRERLGYRARHGRSSG